MSSTAEQIAAAITALDAQRELLGDAVVDTALAPLRRELAALQSPAAGAQQLKQVSVLFVDVVGSTAMGQSLDPETIHAVMDGALERFTAVVETHGGRVLQYTGDGMLAAFGTEATSEDDVEAAIRAGLGIVEQAAQHAPLVRQRHGVPDFNVRAGVHTGRVLLGGGVDAEGSIRGSTVNVAARMEQSAPPGRLRISHDSWRHVRGLFEFDAQPPIEVKGVTRPVRSWLVLRPLPRLTRRGPRGIEGLTTPMVGRDTELGLLHGRLQRAIATRRAHAVTVVGEAGLGKSRLLAEFERGLDALGVRLLLGRAHPRSAVEPFGVLRDLLERWLGIGEAEPAASARSKLVDTLAPLFAAGGEAPAHLIGQLAGFDFSASPHVRDLLGDDAKLRERAFAAGALALRRLGEISPVVLVFDDLHWTDVGSMDFLRHALVAAADAPLLVLALTRQTLYERYPDWMQGVAQHGRIDLRPLDNALSQELAEALLARIDGAPQTLRTLIVERAEGNPFYMEELVKMLIDEGVIVVEAEDWRVVADRLQVARVPPTLTGVLQARLDALTPPERLALQQSAVVGHEFWDLALAAIDAGAPTVLPRLLQRELIVLRGGSPGEYAFKHHLLHQVTYDGVLKASKHDGHASVGAFWRVRAHTDTPLDVDPAHCRALVQAHVHGCQADAKEYVGWFEHEFQNYHHAYAAQTLRPLAEQLVEVCTIEFGPEHPQTARALTDLARIELQLRDVGAVESQLRRALAIQVAALPPDHADTSRTLAALGGLHESHGDYAAAEPYLEQALEMRVRVLGADHQLALAAMDHVAKVRVELGRLDEAESLLQHVLTAHERRFGPAHADTACALTALGEVLAKKGEHARAEPLIRRALEVQQRCLPTDHPDTGLSMWHLGETLRELGRHDETEPLARGALRIWEAAFGPDHEWIGWGLISLAHTRLAQDDATEAAALAARAVPLFERAFGSAHAAVAESLLLYARALLSLGRAADAVPVLQRVHDVRSGSADGALARAAAELLTQARASASLSPGTSLCP